MNERIEQLRAQLREDPSSRLFFQLGELLRKEGQRDEAVSVLRGGLEVYPRYVAAWVSLGRALFESSSYDASEAAFAKALELDPENPIASRMTGEIAISRQDWLGAIKSFKLARVFSPPDEELEEKILFVEDRLAEQGLLEGPRSAVEPPAATADAEAPDDATLILPVPPPMSVAPVPESVPVPAQAAELSSTGGLPTAEGDSFSLEAPPEVFSLSADDPFADNGPRGDTGVFVLGDDVFGDEEDVHFQASLEAGEALAEPAPADAESTEPVAFVPPSMDENRDDLNAKDGAETIPGLDLSAEVEAAEAGLLETEPGEEHEVDTAAIAVPADLRVETEIPQLEDQTDSAFHARDFAERVEEEDSHEAPLPTMTLARLALEQGDHELAERTLQELLEQNPEHEAAGALLREIRGPDAEAGGDEMVVVALAERKVAALQGWLNRLKLAAGEQRT